MKSLKIAIILSINFFTLLYTADWVLVGNINQPGSQPSISAANINSVWIVGGTSGSPKIFKSVNGGYNWSVVQTAGITEILSCVTGFSEQTAYVAEGEVSGGADMFRTTNGGTSWTPILTTGPNRGFFNGMVFTKANGNLFGLAIAERIYRSSNSGQNWVELNSAVVGVSNAHNSLFIIDNNFYGFGLNNGSARVRLTTDNSSTWTTQQVNISGNYTSAIAYSSTKMIGLAATSSSMPIIGRSIDGGISWTAVNIGSGVTGNCFLNWIPDGPVVYIMGENGGIKRSTDNSLTWVTTPSPVNNLKHFDFIQYNNIVVGYAVSSDGNVIKLMDTLSILTGNVSNNDPVSFALHQNYPNPFNPVTEIEYSIARKSFVKILVYDALGREISAPVQEIKAAGKYKLSFDGTGFNSGVYFYRINAGNYTETRKMILLK